jgi:hypothetical protein
MRSRDILLFAAYSLTLAGCSDYFSKLPTLGFLKSAPISESLQIESEPVGAKAEGADGAICQTPCQLVAPVGSDFSVTVSKPGYKPVTVTLHPTGAGGQLEPNPVLAKLQSAGPAAKKSPAQKTKAKQATPPATLPLDTN